MNAPRDQAKGIVSVATALAALDDVGFHTAIETANLLRASAAAPATDEAAEEPEKPRRRRRTKAEIAADELAAEESVEVSEQ